MRYNNTLQESIGENSPGIFLANYSSISMQFYWHWQPWGQTLEATKLLALLGRGTFPFHRVQGQHILIGGYWIRSFFILDMQSFSI